MRAVNASRTVLGYLTQQPASDDIIIQMGKTVWAGSDA